MNRSGILTGAISAGALVLVWSVAARITALPFILPAPLSVFHDCLTLAGSADFARMLAATCGRGISAFLVSLVLSFILGFASGVSPGFSAALRPWMSTIKATPVVSIILIALLWFGSSIVPVFVAVLMTLPVMTEAIARGVMSSDRKLLQMAEVYRMGNWRKFLHIRVPSALPFFVSGAGASLGLTWKVVVAGEILSSPRAGIGTAMQTAKVQLETARVFSLTLTAIFLSVLTELLFDALVHLSRRHSGKDGNS